MKKALSIILALTMLLCLFAGCAPTNTDSTGGSQGGNEQPLAGTYDIKVWVAENIVDLTKTQIENFNKTNTDGIKINATVEPVGEGDAATSMSQDVENGADLFCFAQDQTARLIQAGALQKLGNAAAEIVKNSHDKASITAVTSGDSLYGYPLTSDNGYFMYYDKSVISEEDVGSLEKIIAACEAAGKNFSFELENSWYIVSFFFATGCLSEWSTDEAGKFIDVNDNFNSDIGKIAAEGMKKLLTSKCYVNSSATTDFSAAIPSAVVVSGTWNYENAKDQLGDNMGVAKLPSFVVGDKSYQLGSYNGCKLMGVKPQKNSVRAAVINKLAQYLTGEEAQLERFNAAGWGPSNIAAQGSDAVKAAPHLTALMEQNNYSRPQGQIHGSWWDIAKVIATSIKEGMAIDEALNNYETSMKALFTMSDEVLKAWTVIGSINGDGWSVDLPMTKQDDGSWKSNEAYTMDAGVEFKCRQGKNWDVSIGNGGENFKVEEAGTYYIVLTLNDDGVTGTITLEKA